MLAETHESGPGRFCPCGMTRERAGSLARRSTRAHCAWASRVADAVGVAARKALGRVRQCRWAAARRKDGCTWTACCGRAARRARTGHAHAAAKESVREWGILCGLVQQLVKVAEDSKGTAVTLAAQVQAAIATVAHADNISALGSLASSRQVAEARAKAAEVLAQRLVAGQPPFSDDAIGVAAGAGDQEADAKDVERLRNATARLLVSRSGAALRNALLDAVGIVEHAKAEAEKAKAAAVAALVTKDGKNTEIAEQAQQAFSPTATHRPRRQAMPRKRHCMALQNALGPGMHRQ
ncbi:hypothetical protein ERJ75_000548000 [Trypanosoma vivax]|nr:hypothetical protein ERJ75_000548000 [Trypanosoma vivax]